MAFKWEVYEVSKEIEIKQDGGEIDLECLVVTGFSSWEIDLPDVTITLAPEAGGAIEKLGRSKKKGSVISQEESRIAILRDIDKWFIQGIILILVALMGLSFLAVVISELVRGNLGFDKFVAAIMSFLSGVGVMLIKQNKKTKRD